MHQAEFQRVGAEQVRDRQCNGAHDKAIAVATAQSAGLFILRGTTSRNRLLAQTKHRGDED